MTVDKDFKRLVRARMVKTGEAYTTARAQLLQLRTRRRSTRKVATAVRYSAPPLPTDYAAIAGMSEAAIKEGTGCTWERWVKSLDYHGAAQMKHADIAKLIKAKYKTPDWWTQTVTVGYERIKGLRVRGQQRDRTYQATKSRTFAVPVARLFDAWADAKRRGAWLNGAEVKVRTAKAPKSMRLIWSDGSIVSVAFSSKGNGKSAVAVEHTRLPDRDSVNRIKQFWSERFDALAVKI